MITKILWLVLLINAVGCAPLLHTHKEYEKQQAYQACELTYMQHYLQYEEESKKTWKPENPFKGPSNCYSIHFGDKIGRAHV